MLYRCWTLSQPCTLRCFTLLWNLAAHEAQSVFPGGSEKVCAQFVSIMKGRRKTASLKWSVKKHTNRVSCEAAVNQRSDRMSVLCHCWYQTASDPRSQLYLRPAGSSWLLLVLLQWCVMSMFRSVCDIPVIPANTHFLPASMVNGSSGIQGLKSDEQWWGDQWRETTSCPFCWLHPPVLCSWHTAVDLLWCVTVTHTLRPSHHMRHTHKWNRDDFNRQRVSAVMPWSDLLAAPPHACCKFSKMSEQLEIMFLLWDFPATVQLFKFPAAESQTPWKRKRSRSSSPTLWLWLWKTRNPEERQSRGCGWRRIRIIYSWWWHHHMFKQQLTAAAAPERTITS